MEKRREPRFETERAVRLNVLGDPCAEMTARIVNISGTGMRIMVDRPLALGVALQVEWDDMLLRGDVCYCQPMEDGHAIGLKLEQALLHTRELAKLSRALLAVAEAAQTGAPQSTPVRKQPER
jgi:hypothetical protein